MTCPVCGQPTEANWAVCPYCQVSLSTTRDVRILPQVPPKEPVNPFTCYRQSWAVVIGIDQYRQVPPLSCAVADAQAVAAALQYQGFPSSRIFTLYNQEATRQNILDLMSSEMSNRTGPQDRLLVFFAGHGQDFTLPSGQKMGFLFPIDGDPQRLTSRCLPMEEVDRWNRLIPAKHILYVLDCCYSGLVATRTTGLSPHRSDYLEQITTAPVRQVITAGQASQMVLEENGHGIFTRVFLRALAGAADTNARGFITGSDLGHYLGDRVFEESSWKQRPLFRFLSGDGEFLFFGNQKGTAIIEQSQQQGVVPEGIIQPGAGGGAEAVSVIEPVQPDRARAGQTRWMCETGGRVTSSPAGSGDIVYVGSWDHHLYALDVQSGGLRWRYETGAPVESSPTVSGGIVYVGSDDGHLYALDVQSGELRWRYQTGHLVTSSPTVSGGIVYVGSDDGHLYALDVQSGELRWRYQTGGGVSSSPAVSGGIVYVGSDDRHLYAFDARNGQLRWRYETGHWVSSSPAVSGGIVYVGSKDHHLYALDARNGEHRWRYQTGDWVRSSPIVSGGIVYVGSYDNHLYALDALSGELRWGYRTGGYVDSSPTVFGGIVYVGSDDGHLYALDVRSGELRWRYQTGDEVESSPTVFGDIVYVGSYDKHLYALSTG